MFDVRGIVPVGYAAFAFALGVTAGVVLRRTVPAMAVTLVGFTAVRLAVTYYVRPYLMGSLRAVTPLVMGTGNGPAPVPGAGVLKPGDWVLSAQTINGAGQVIGAYGGVGPTGDISFQRVPRNGQPRRRRPLPEHLPGRRRGPRHDRTAAQPPRGL